MGKLMRSTFLFIFVATISACGGGGSSDSPTKTTGQFIDDPVQGLDYSCSSGDFGVTNANGEYTCNIGDDVTFSIGPVTLGTLSAQSTFFTPYSLFPNDTQSAVNLARLLQSIDSDSNPNNNLITLSSAQLIQLPVNTDFADSNFVAEVEAALGITLIDTMTAMNHLNDAIILNGGDIPNGGHLPVANAGTDLSVVAQNAVTLNGDGSFDADGDSLTFSWSIASRPAASVSLLFTDQNTSTPTLTPDVVGDYVVQLIVNDGVVNSVADMVTITSTANNNPSDASPSLAWVKEVRVETSGGQAGGIAFDSNNNLYMAAESLIDFNGDLNSGYQDVLIVKYDAAGDMLWSDLTGTANSDLVENIVFDKTENTLYVVGHTSLSLHDQTVFGDRDIFIIKYDEDGNRLWTIMDGTVREERPYDVALDSAGNIFIAGVTYGDFDGETTRPTGRDIFVAKYNSSGTKVWTRQLQGDNWERAEGIAIDSNDNVYITGYTASTELDEQATEGIDSFVIKYSNDGTKLWSRLISSAGTEYGYGVTTDSNNNVFVTGITNGDLGGNINRGGYDQFTVKYTTNGALLWTTLTGGTLYDGGKDIVMDASDRIYTTGLTEKTEIGDRFDYVLTMFDTDGEELWTIQNSPEYGNIRDDRGEYLALDSTGNIYVNGTTYASFFSVNEAGSNKVFIARYNKNVSAGGPYSVGGTVTGAIGSFTLMNNGGDTLFINDNGSFTFETLLNDGALYNVQVLDGSDTSQGHLCEVLSGGSNGDGTGIINGADVVDIQVSCVGI